MGSVRAVRSLTNAEASRGLPVALEATVTYYRDYDIDLFVQDGDAAVYVLFRAGAGLLPGDRVLVRGKTQGSFRPIVVGESVTVLSHGTAPRPVTANVAQLFRAQLDCMRVTAHGVARSAVMLWSAGKRNIYLQVQMDGGEVDAAVNSEDEGALKNLLDAEVEVTGVVTSKFDQKMQQTGATLDVQSLADIRTLKRASAAPSSLPETSMDDVLGGYHVQDQTQRVHVKGTITYYDPGSAVVLQNGTKSLWLITMTDVPLRVGDLAEASGFPDVRNGYLALDHSEIRDSQAWAPITPLPVTWEGMDSGANAFNLVSTEGQVLMEARESSKDEYVLMSGGHLFSAIYRHPSGATGVKLPPMRQIPIGSRVRVTGISTFYSSDPFNGPVASDLLLRSFDDIAVVAGPPWLSIGNLVRMVVALLVVVLLVAARGWTLASKVRRQTVAMARRTEAEAELERRRSQILEEISGTKPLAGILERITELVSFGLQGAPCWFEIEGGANLGIQPVADPGSNLLELPIPSRTGPPLGVIHGALAAGLQPNALHTEALAIGARLAALAIETRDLYSDLLHRSEFDQLTDIHNRFSLEKYLDLRIEEARRTAGIFGLIYMDLDDFKQVNDLYGHQVGDLYLQELALRMKRQLRSHDMLARLGGDEFAVLVPVVKRRADVEEVAQRLSQCFVEPLEIEGYRLQASASFGIALYPEDGESREALLSVSDAAMYFAKYAKH